MRNVFSILLLLVITTNVTAKKMETTGDTTKLKKLCYFDGSGNLYELKNDSIFYSPITNPLESSSGIYTGGKPARKALNAGEYKTTEKMFRELIRNKKNPPADRIKGSGIVIIIEDKKQEEAIIESGPENDKVENYLKSLLK